MIPKSFTYGDLWPGTEVKRKDQHGMVEINPGDYLKNKAYTYFIDTLGYKVYLDYDMEEIAKTLPDDHLIIINANYTDTVITSLLKHELGHLMLFNGNAFYSVDKNSMRSIIAKRLYTPSNVKKYGIDQLLRVENIIQDIIIETVSNGKCVCNALMEDYGYRNGVMHLGNLESITQITREVCDNVLIPIESCDDAVKLDGALRSELLESIIDDLKESIGKKQEEKKSAESGQGKTDGRTRELLRGIRGINNKLNHIEKQSVRIDKMKKRHLDEIKKYEQRISRTEEKLNEVRRENETNEKQKSTNGLERKLNNLKHKLESMRRNEVSKTMDENIESVGRLEKELNEELDELKTELSKRNIEEERSKNKQKRIDSIQDSIDRDESLLNELRNELGSADGSNQMGTEDAGATSSDGGQDDSKGHEGYGGHGQDDDAGASGPVGMNNQEGHGCNADDPTPHKNTTDHLLDSDAPESRGRGRSHSWDVSQPRLTRLSKKDRKLLVDFNPIKILHPYKPKRPVHIHQESLNNKMPSQQFKIPEYEPTYFRSNKREINPSDMLKGKRKKRFTGVNVLIGLDVSGSMIDEWRNEYKKISDMVKSIRSKLDINDVKYFTYNTDIVKTSDSIDELEPFPHGGNAFAWVYQQIMIKMPVMLRNEIILVTDCGDNLGFKLDDVCVSDFSGEQIINHVSVIDTEMAGFYDLDSDFDTDDWSIHPCTDDDIEKSISNDIDSLMEK